MYIQQLLYARSRTRDYRWMIKPSGFSYEENLTILENLHSQWRGVMSTHSLDSNLPLVAGLNFPNDSFYCLVAFTETNHKDIHARPIQSMHGICINTDDAAPDLCTMLPWFLSNPEKFDPWNEIDYEGADALYGNVREIEVEPSHYACKGSGGGLNVNIGQKKFIPYTDSGKLSLLTTLEKLQKCDINFIFGGTPVMDVDELRFNFNIFAALFHYRKTTGTIVVKEQKSWHSLALKKYVISVTKKGTTDTIDEEKFSIPQVKGTTIDMDFINSHKQARYAYNKIINRLVEAGWYVSRTEQELQKVGN